MTNNIDNNMNNINDNMNNDMINYNNKQRRSFDFNLGELKNDTSYHSADSISPHSFDERTFILQKKSAIIHSIRGKR